MHVVIFTGGELAQSRLVNHAVQTANLVIAADSGAQKALELGVIPEVVLGDMDSIDPKTSEKLKMKNVKFIVSPTEKDETDTELVIEYALKNGATEVVLLGGLMGNRIDHILANILYAVICPVPVKFINGLQESFVVKGPAQVSLRGDKNDLLSLIPLQEDVTGLKSDGLKWELHNAKLSFGFPRGVSNELTQERVTLAFSSGNLFVTHTHQK